MCGTLFSPPPILIVSSTARSAGFHSAHRTRVFRFHVHQAVHHPTNWLLALSSLVICQPNHLLCTGVYGTAGDIETQLSPVCVGACPAGSLCPSATHTPLRAPRRQYNTRPVRATSSAHAFPPTHTAQLARPAHFARAVLLLVHFAPLVQAPSVQT